jgi:alpha-tubulin suppressor-like RCC1 family protein
VTGIAAPGIASIAAGWVYALALGTDGSVWGWGNDASGELGNAPTSTAALRPVQTRLPGSGIVQLAASSELIAEVFTGRVFLHTLALRSDGTVWAWGDNTAGQLGDGGTADRPGRSRSRAWLAPPRSRPAANPAWP